MSDRPKYGLYIPPKKPAQVKKSNLDLFGEDDANVQRPLLNQLSGITADTSLSIAKKRQTERIQKEALAEDPAAFLYDEVVHNEDRLMGKQLLTKITESKRPKYMESLLTKAAERKALNEVARVRMAKREVEKDAEQFKDKEVFVTESYKRKLEELKGKLEEDRKEDGEDVTKRKDMSGFYQNLLEKNVAFGAGTGGRLREQQKQSRPSSETNKTYGIKQNKDPSNVESDEEEEFFGPARRQ